MASNNSKARRSVFLNSLFGVLAWFLPIVLGFFSTPIIVRGLGTEEYGVYAIILGFLSYSFTFGIGRVASKYVAEFEASGNDDGISRAVSATLLFSVAVGAIGAILLAFFTPWLVANVLILPEAFRPKAEIGLYLACFAGLMVMISQVFQSTLQGAHRFGSYSVIANLNAVLLSGGNIALALNGYGLVELVAWNLFTVITTGVLFFVTAITAIPNFRPTLNIGKDVGFAVLKYGRNIILYQVFANCFFLFERSWVIRKFGPEALTFYFVPMLIGIYLHGLISSFGLVIFPRINELLNDRERLLILYGRSNRLILAIVVLTVTTLAASGKSFLLVWVGPEFETSSYWLLVIHGLTFGLIAIIIIPWGLAEAFHAASINVFVTFAWLVIGSSLMYAVGTSFGIEGIAVARLTAVLATMPVIFYIEKRFLGRVQIGSWSMTVLKIVPASVLMFVAQWFVLRNMVSGWFSLILAVGIGSGIYTALLYSIGLLDSNEIDELKNQLFRRGAQEG